MNELPVVEDINDSNSDSDSDSVDSSSDSEDDELGIKRRRALKRKLALYSLLEKKYTVNGKAPNKKRAINRQHAVEKVKEMMLQEPDRFRRMYRLHPDDFLYLL